MGERRRPAAGAVPTSRRRPSDGEFSGWYLRGDVGGGVNSTTPELQDRADPIAAGAAGGFLSGAATPRRSTTRPYRRSA